MTKVLLLLVIFNLTHSTPEWSAWVNQRRALLQERFAQPAITHHVYISARNGRSCLSKAHSYVRFVDPQKDDCLWLVHSDEKGQITVRSKKDNKLKPLSLVLNGAVPLAIEDSIYLSAHSLAPDEEVRLFVYDLNQPDLSEKRKTDFFKYDSQWRVQGEFHKLAQPQSVVVQRSDGSQKKVLKWAEIKGLPHGLKLSVYDFLGDIKKAQTERVTMLLFRDKTNGHDTYGAGRFLNFKSPKDFGDLKKGEKVTLDFNYSYNPPCAVSSGFHCPLPQDWVDQPIAAGEKYLRSKK